MARSTRLVILIKNIYTLWGRKRFLLHVTYFPTNLVYPFTLKGTSELSLSNKMLLYRSIVIPSFTYCIQIWGTALDSNVMRVQRVQNRALRTIAHAPWDVRNDVLACDLHIPTVRGQINMHSSRYNDRLLAHINHLAASLANRIKTRRRLKRRHPGDLWTRGRQVSRVLKQ